MLLFHSYKTKNVSIYTSYIVFSQAVNVNLCDMCVILSAKVSTFMKDIPSETQSLLIKVCSSQFFHLKNLKLGSLVNFWNMHILLRF